ncbi:MAG: DJ-1/PfpI family protein [Desulfocapsaceae bacterium]|nr:DJ-1/PfpI family protein [Desulfocapsaceae bacterium]
MKTAFILFDRMTSMDFVGIFDPLTRLKTMGFLPDFDWAICSFAAEITDDRGLRFIPDTVAASLSNYDLLVVPGGIGTRGLQFNEGFVAWLRTAEPVKLKVSVCTGALLLGAAGFLDGREATTHPLALDELRPYCRHVVARRIVDEGDIITAAGVTASIDLGLHLVERLAGPKARISIAGQMDYPYKEPERQGTVAVR